MSLYKYPFNGCFLRRFIHPIVYGEYPKTMQDIVKERLPEFTEEEVKMVKGSIDFVGINQYTTYYMSAPSPTTNPKDLGYQQDWNVIFNCTFFFIYIRSLANDKFLYIDCIVTINM